ncbi:putative chaperonin 10 [Paratrimastix pyriformis]|uniref:Chaperonin 10 n=1 Tax=Paratrimastix pyriformis TaxID=342808 RepID=A0ABQ8USF9_9EUKA|nr:putative chaperonin 10 [Paratrimastix pyriformis]
MEKSFVPLLNRVLVRQADVTGALGGVLIPSTVQTPVKIGIVEAVGIGHRTNNGTVLPPLVKKGDKVLLPETGGIPIRRENKDYLLLHDDELLGVFH